MAYVLRASTVKGAATANIVTADAIDTSGADLLVVCAAWYPGAVPNPTLSDNKGNSWTALTSAVNPPSYASRLYYVRGGIVGSGHTFTLAGSPIYASIYVTAWSGSVASPFDQQNATATASGVSTFQPGNVTPSQANELIITGMNSGDPLAGAVSINSGFTVAGFLNSSSGFFQGGGIAYLVQTSAAAVNPTWNVTNNSSGPTAVIATFKGTAPVGTTGVGALAAGAASGAGAGVSRSTGAGVLAAQAAALSGIGTAFSVTAGTGALVAQGALVSGVGTLRTIGVGALAAQSATLAGTGAAQGAGQGVLAAQSATLSGAGTIGLATVSGAGTLVAGQASLSATGASETTGTGALNARAATLAGQFIVTTGAGALNAGRATVAGSGTTTGDSSSVDFEGDLIDVIGPLVGGRAYPNTYPQDCIWPAIRYTLVSVEPYDDLCSHAEAEDGTETADVRVQFDLVAETYTQSRDLRVAMRKAMRRFDPPALMSAEFNTYDVETKVHRVVMDYVFYPSSD